MEALYRHLRIAALLILFIVAGAAVPSGAAPAKTPAARTNAVVEIPKSVFTMPATVKEGRDPFYPNSVRVYTANPVKVKQTASTVSLSLNGISGMPGHRLVMINNRTFEEGEDADIDTSAGRVHVRCVQITADSAIVEIAGERRELRLPPGL